MTTIRQRGYVSILDYDVDTNGVRDCYDAIMAAIEAASPRVGPHYQMGTVYFPPGQYKVSQRIEIKRTVRLLGSGSAVQNYGPVLNFSGTGGIPRCSK